MAGKIATKQEQIWQSNQWAHRKETVAAGPETIGAAKTEVADKAGREAGQQDTGITKFLLDNSADGNAGSVRAFVSLEARRRESKKKVKKREGPTLAERWANSPEWLGEQTEATGEMGGGSLEPEV